MNNFPMESARRPRLLDLFCGQGGAGKGYQDAGFEVTGVDIRPMTRLPPGMGFVHADAMEFMRQGRAEGFDAVHASPPCRAYTRARGAAKGRWDHPDLVAVVRQALEGLGAPWVMENVVGAPLGPDSVLLCGTMFGLRVYRHRLFETGGGFAFRAPGSGHPAHEARTAKMGRAAREGEFLSIAGSFSGLELARKVMGMPWANQDGIRQAIPPAYTEYVGSHMMGYLSEL